MGRRPHSENKKSWPGNPASSCGVNQLFAGFLLKTSFTGGPRRNLRMNSTAEIRLNIQKPQLQHRSRPPRRRLFMLAQSCTRNPSSTGARPLARVRAGGTRLFSGEMTGCGSGSGSDAGQNGGVKAFVRKNACPSADQCLVFLSNSAARRTTARACRAGRLSALGPVQVNLDYYFGRCRRKPCQQFSPSASMNSDESRSLAGRPRRRPCLGASRFSCW